ncbi:hypothetical protein [Rhodococcus jostii]|uniref:hypothetical protein n=1 Tax=Rhodococcus jostii TaxID=132919 RepID=UPI00363AB79D
MSKERDGAKVTKKYDIATTPHRRADQHEAVTGEDKAILADTYSTINPAAVQRQIQALTTELIALATAKNTPTRRAPLTRALLDESTNQTSRAS